MRHGVLAKVGALVLVPLVWVGMGWGGWIQTALLWLVLAVASVPFNAAALVLAFVPVVGSGPIASFVTKDLGTLYLGALACVSVAAVLSGRLVGVREGAPLGHRSLARLVPLLTKTMGIAAVCAAWLALDRAYPLMRNLSWLILLTAFWLALRRLRSPRQPDPVALTRRNTRLAGWALMVFSILVSLGVLEAGARLLLPPAPIIGYLEYDPRYIFLLRPDSQAHYSVSLGDDKRKQVEVTVSSQGLRDEVIPEKEPGEFRVCMLGDSFTMGHATTLQDSIPKQLEARLRAKAPGLKIRVVNCGLGGAGCLQELGMLRERALPLKPDLVVLQLFPGNDIDNALEVTNKLSRCYDVRWIQSLDEYRYHALLRSRLDLWAFRHLRAYQSLCELTGERWITAVAERCRLVPWIDLPRHPDPENRLFLIEVDLKEWYPELEEGFRIMLNYTKQMQKESKESGAEFMAYCIPDLHDLSQRLWDAGVNSANPPAEYEQGKAVRLTEEALKRYGILCAPVAEALRAYGNEEETYYPFDGHLSELGNGVVADTLAAAIQDRLLDR